MNLDYDFPPLRTILLRSAVVVLAVCVGVSVALATGNVAGLCCSIPFSYFMFD